MPIENPKADRPVSQKDAGARIPVDPHAYLNDVGYEAGSFPEGYVPPHRNTLDTAVKTFGAVVRSVERAVPHVVKEVEQVVDHLRHPEQVRSLPNADQEFEAFRQQFSFEERDSKLRLDETMLDDAYQARIVKSRNKTGKLSGAEAGVGSIDDAKLMIYRTVYGFMGGSVGSIEGEKLVRAVEEAVKDELPFFAWYATGGMRQDESFRALRQLQRIVAARAYFIQNSREISVAALVGNVYGGSSVELMEADIVIAQEGSNMGFAGPKVISNFESGGRKEIPQGSQGVEAHYEGRRVDFLFRDANQLGEWTRRLLKHSGESRDAELNEETLSNLPPLEDIPDYERFPLHRLGYSSLLDDMTPVANEEAQVFSGKRKEVNVDDVFDRYQAHQRNPYRFDTEYVIRQLGTDIVPFYNRFSDGKFVKYPAIIFALAKIGGQTVLIGGDQPSYQIIGGNLLKIPASPTPEHFDYLKKMLEMGDRMGIPALLLTDLFGANATLLSEQKGQPKAIGAAIRAGIQYKSGLVEGITGVLGSGGGIATTPNSVQSFALENAFGFVAEARSSKVITSGNPSPSDEEVRQTILDMKATARELQSQGFVDDVIEEPDNGWNNPVGAVINIREHVVRKFTELQGISPDEMVESRWKNVVNDKGLPFLED